MLALIDIPPDIFDLHNKLKRLGVELKESLSYLGEEKRIAGRSNIINGDSSSFFYVLEGVFKFQKGDKLIRLFSEKDFVNAYATDYFSQYQMINDFAVDVIDFPKEAFLKAIFEDIHLIEMWNQYQSMELHLTQKLCGLYVQSELRPYIDLKEFSPGSVIIEEGRDSEEIYELTNGEAIVSVKGLEIGVVKQDEIFGEMSFFMESKRTASVIAKTACMVNVLKRADFLELIKLRPQMMYNISKNLANRVHALDAKIIEQK